MRRSRSVLLAAATALFAASFHDLGAGADHFGDPIDTIGCLLLCHDVIPPDRSGLRPPVRGRVAHCRIITYRARTRRRAPCSAAKRNGAEAIRPASCRLLSLPPSRKGRRHGGNQRAIRATVAARHRRGRPGLLDRQMHRSAAELDGTWRAVAGVFSSDSARSRAAGAAMGFDGGRSYGDLGEMLERERRRADPIDAVAIMTPNDTHYARRGRGARRGPRRGLRQAGDARFRAKRAIWSRARDGKQRLFAIAHAYSAYPMTRHARALVRDGTLGDAAARPGRVHPERPRDTARGWPAEQPVALGARYDAERAVAGDERDRLPRAAPCVLRRRLRALSVCAPIRSR